MPWDELVVERSSGSRSRGSDVGGAAAAGLMVIEPVDAAPTPLVGAMGLDAGDERRDDAGKKHGSCPSGDIGLGRLMHCNIVRGSAALHKRTRMADMSEVHGQKGILPRGARPSNNDIFIPY